MKNMAASLAQQLKMDSATIEIELSRGFSSLVELYKSSSLHIDKKTKTWQETGEDGRNVHERKAGNLLIIIDQFEEFFTNPENFPQGFLPRIPDSCSILFWRLQKFRCEIICRSTLCARCAPIISDSVRLSVDSRNSLAFHSFSFHVCSERN